MSSLVLESSIHGSPQGPMSSGPLWDLEIRFPFSPCRISIIHSYRLSLQVLSEGVLSPSTQCLSRATCHTCSSPSASSPPLWPRGFHTGPSSVPSLMLLHLPGAHTLPFSFCLVSSNNYNKTQVMFYLRQLSPNS